MKKCLGHLNAVLQIRDRVGFSTHPWVIVGGMSFALRGGGREPADVDIITSSSGARRFAAEFIEGQVTPLRHSRSSNVFSLFTSLRISGVLVEVVGDPINIIKGRWCKNVMWKRSIEIMRFAGRDIPVSSLDYEIYINSQIENRARVEEIENFSKRSPARS